MDFIAGLFIGFSFWHVIWIVLFLGCGIFSATAESVGGFIFTFILFLLGLQFVAGVDLWNAAIGAPFAIFLSLVGYFAIGGLYALFISWPAYLKRNSVYIQQDYKTWKDMKNRDARDVKPSAEELSVENFQASYEYQKSWSATKNIDRNTAYITNWFFDAIWRVLSDPIVWLWETTYAFFAKGFATVGLKTTKGILDASTDK